jgi:hypothetical protein
MVGINKFEGKDRRRVRRRNMMAKELREPKYRPRVVPGRKAGDITDTDGSHYWDYEEETDE